MNNPITHITKVEIQGLFGRYDIVWNLHPDVNVLAGINGSGKTTILSAIYKFICNKAIKDVFFKKIILYFDNGKNITSTKEIKTIYVEKDTREVKYRAGIRELLDNIELNLIHTFDSEAKPQELLQKADNEVKTELDWELWNLQREYLNYQVDLGKKLRANKENFNDNPTYFHDKFLEIIDTLFLETHKKVNRDKNELEFLSGDKEINVYQLSSGEKQLLIILLTVLVQNNKPSILLLDEPEISLHIEWQRKLIKYIRELNPNVQIIIATHSPDIIVHGWMDNVFNLQDLIVKDNIAQ